MQSLEKMYKAEILLANRRIDSLNQENVTLKQELQNLGKKPAPPPQIAVVNPIPAPQPQIPGHPPWLGLLCQLKSEKGFQNLFQSFRNQGGGVICRLLQEKLELEGLLAPMSGDPPRDRSESSNAFEKTTGIPNPQTTFGHEPDLRTFQPDLPKSDLGRGGMVKVSCIPLMITLKSPFNAHKLQRRHCSTLLRAKVRRI